MLWFGSGTGSSLASQLARGLWWQKGYWTISPDSSEGCAHYIPLNSLPAQVLLSHLVPVNGARSQQCRSAVLRRTLSADLPHHLNTNFYLSSSVSAEQSVWSAEQDVQTHVCMGAWASISRSIPFELLQQIYME